MNINWLGQFEVDEMTPETIECTMSTSLTVGILLGVNRPPTIDVRANVHCEQFTLQSREIEEVSLKSH